MEAQREYKLKYEEDFTEDEIISLTRESINLRIRQIDRELKSYFLSNNHIKGYNNEGLTNHRQLVSYRHKLIKELNTHLLSNFNPF